MARARAATSAAFFLQGFVFAAIVTQMPRNKERFGLTDGDVTAVLVVVALVCGVGSVLAGVAAQRWDSRMALVAALVVIGVGAPLVGAAGSVPWLFVTFVVYGLGLGAVDATMNMQGVRVQAEAGRSLMTGFHGFWSVGGIVGAGYASLVAHLEVPLAADLLLVGAVTVVVALVAGPHLVAAREVDPGLRAEGLPWRPVLVFGAVILIFYAADTGTLTWSSVYLDDALGASAAVVPLGYAAYQVGALVSRFGGDLLVRRHGARAVVTAAVSVGTVGYLAVVLAPTPWPAVVAFGLAALGTGVLAPLAFAALGDAVPAHTLDVAIARMNLANYVGAILGGGVIGAVAEGGELRWAFVVPLALVPLVLLTRRSFPARAVTTG